jgi:hypothetical protein
MSTFRWRFLNLEGNELGRSDAFDERSEAEEWMGGAWSGLLSDRVEQVELVDEEEGRTLYRMGLRER